VIKVGDWFKLGEFSYQITHVATTAVIGDNPYLVKRATDGGVFVLVYYLIRNEGTETATVMSDDFELKTANGDTYKSDAGATTALVPVGVDGSSTAAQRSAAGALWAPDLPVRGRALDSGTVYNRCSPRDAILPTGN
jgi:hypothetical protein